MYCNNCYDTENTKKVNNFEIDHKNATSISMNLTLERLKEIQLT